MGKWGKPSQTQVDAGDRTGFKLHSGRANDREAGEYMSSCPSLLILYIALSLCVLARIALFWIKKARHLRQICRELITADMRQQGRNPSPMDVEEVLGELEEKEANQ